MAEKLNPYEDYKETGLLWLDKVPGHWRRQTIRSFTKQSSVRNNGRRDLELLSVYREYGVIRKSSRDDNHNVESADLSNYKYVDVGYIVLNKMKMWQGSLGVSKYKGIVSPAYIVCELYGDIAANYIHYLLRSPVYKVVYNMLSYGVRVGQWDMRYDDFKNIAVYLPPYTEQNQIVRFLDYKLSKVAKFIHAKKKLIEVLKEQKQAIINRAVTKGLDPNAKMKPSGIDWLGDVPEGWHFRPFAKIAKVCSNLVHPAEYSDYMQVSPANIEKGSGKLQSCVTVKDSSIISDNHLFYKGQILYSKIRPLLNKVTIAPFDGLCSADMYPIETSLLSKYLQYYMLSPAFLSQLAITENRVKMPKINKEELSNIIVVFPDETEQLKIANYISAYWESIDRIIDKYETEIILITEYRARLISDVVTGKVDVSGVEVPDVMDTEASAEEYEESEEDNAPERKED